MTEETIPPLKTAIAIEGRPMEGTQDANDTTKDKRKKGAGSGKGRKVRSTEEAIGEKHTEAM